MSSFTTLRVLVTLVVTISLLSSGSVGRPLPSSSPNSLKVSSRQLISTSPILPLPPLIIAGQKRASSFTQQRPKPIMLSRTDDEHLIARSGSHDHEHDHIHEHDHEHDHDYPDRWRQEEMDHHSNHWAWHHGLMHDDDHNDSHEHDHEHIHSHKREEETESMDALSERGLVGDLAGAVRPLLAPLEVLPGFVTIENLLFGDGDEDGGLLKTLGGLLLKVEPSQTKDTPNEYAFSLLASKHERTQVYLAPVNDTTSDTACSDDDTTTTPGDVLTVRVKLPILDMKGAAVLMCASVANAPPSAMALESCGSDDTTDNLNMNGTSQFFSYIRSTGALAPILMQAQSYDAVPNTVDATDGTSSNTTTTDTDPTKSKMLMHFSLVSNTTSVDDGTNNSNDDTTDFPAVDSAPSEEMARRQITTDGDEASITDDEKIDNPAVDSADSKDADSDDTSKIFLAVTMLANGTSTDDGTASPMSSSSSTPPSKLCKAKM